ncbi:helix-turn-helix domain-containing protein [Flammeovirgaceae bacterium SG7u.111]|nr:helix-turn-helix domain-containing protein [Flammeovirgaceae bacterium SG7u.132]WPO37835.1 helix-turn-helix domain-containing protein [Flammeovirgaceae bacterium SG7u.111]
MNQKSIAVLPFKNISSDVENEYFADGMTEELINAISKIDGLKVTARTSSFAYKNKQVDVRHVGNDLGVSMVLEGSVRKAKDSVRIGAQLIRTDNGFHIWSESFDRKLENIFELQDEISLLIADKIRENFGHIEIEEHLVQSQTKNIEAYQLYLKGRFYQLNWKLEDFPRAIELYKQSIQLDSSYYQPYFGIVQCLGILASWTFIDKKQAAVDAEKYLAQGMAIKANSPEGALALATHSFWVNWDVQAGLSHLKKALGFSPNDTEALEATAECYTAIGEFEKALLHINKGLEYNPLSANHCYTKGNVYYLDGQLDKAIFWMDKSLDIDPQWDLALQIKACCFVLTKDKTSLVELTDHYPTLPNKKDFILLYEVINEYKEVKEDDFSKDHTGYLPWEIYVPLYLGDTQKAIEALKFGIANRLGQYINFLNDPFLIPLREIPAYQHLASKTFIGKETHLPLTKKLAKEPPVLSASELEVFKVALLEVMEEKQPYLSPELSLRSLAETIQLHPNKLSRLLNEEIGKNFNDFINDYRLKAFQAKAINPTNNHLTLLGLAFESGFNSKSVFNDFFKKTTGLTPKAWVKENRKKY